MAKKQILGLILARFDPNFFPKTFLREFFSNTCYTLLQGIIVFNFNEN